MKRLKLDGTPATGTIHHGEVDVYRCEVRNAGDFAFHSQSRAAHVLELRTTNGDAIDSDEGQYNLEVGASLERGTYYVSVSGMTRRTHGYYALTGQRVGTG